MFVALELMFKDCEHMFKVVEHKFKGVEHKILLGEKMIYIIRYEQIIQK